MSYNYQKPLYASYNNNVISDLINNNINNHEEIDYNDDFKYNEDVINNNNNNNIYTLIIDHDIPDVLCNKLLRWNQIDQEEELGNGAFGVVYKGILVDNNQPIAIKMCDINHARTYLPDCYNENDIIESFYWESVNLALLDHPNIIQLIGVCIESDHRSVILELCDDMDLKKSIENGYIFTVKEQITMFLMLCDGLSYMHSKGIIHKDIKVENILLFRNNNVKWADMGVSSVDSLIQSNQIQIVDDGVKDRHWMSYEETHGYQATKKSDIYSFGLVMYSVMKQQEHWWPNDNNNPFALIKSGNVLDVLDINNDWWCSDIIRQCLDNDANNRPTSNELINKICNQASLLSYNDIILQYQLNKTLYTTAKQRQYSYIENMCSMNRSDKTPNNKSILLTNVAESFLNNNNKRVLVLLGDGGTGKSIGLHVIANKYKHQYTFIDIRSTVNEWSLNAIHNFCNNNNYPDDCIYLYDAHDELVNRNQLNVSLIEWLGLCDKAKLIITCRHNIVPMNDESRIFGNNHIMRFILPFSKQQINEYLQRYNIESTNINNEEVLTNPLVLSLYVSSNSYIQSSNEYNIIKRKDIYDAAIRAWYEEAVGLDNEVKNKLGLSFDNFIEFVCEVSMLMYCNNNTVSMELINSNNNINSPWLQLDECVIEVCNNQLANRERSIVAPDDYINMKLQSLNEEYLSKCPLHKAKNSNNNYKFIHKTFRDYFCGLAYTRYTNKYIESKLVTDDISIQRWCSEFVDIAKARQYVVGTLSSDMINNEAVTSFSERAFERIDESKKYMNNESKSIGAANCMTVLNTAGVPLSGRNFSGCQLGRIYNNDNNADDDKKDDDEYDSSINNNIGIFMDLGGAILHSCNFHGANLSGARLQQAMLDEADITECNMKDVIFGEMPAFKGHKSIISVLVISSNNLYSGSHDKTIKHWSIHNGKLLHTFEGHSRGVTTLCVSSDNKYLYSGSNDRTVKQWSINTGKLLHTFDANSGVRVLTISSDNKYIFSGCNNKTIKQWSIATRESVHSFGYKGHTSYINALVISSDNQFLYSSSNDRTIKQWSIETGQRFRTFKGYTASVNALVISSDNKFLFSGSADNTIKQWCTTTGEVVRTFEGHTNYIKSMAVSCDDMYIFSGSWDKTIKQWSLHTGELIRTFEENGNVEVLTVSSDKNFLFSCCEGNDIKQWSINTGDLVRASLERHLAYVGVVTTSHDNRFLFSGSGDKTIKQWSIATGEIIHTFKGGHYGDINALTVSYNNEYLFSGSYDWSIKQWSIITGELIHTYKGHTNSICSLVVSYDNANIFSGSNDNTIRQWSIITGELIRVYKGHTMGINTLFISFDNNYLFSSSNDQINKQWNIETGELINGNIIDQDVFIDFGNNDTTKGFILSGNKIMQLSVDGNMIIWSSPPFVLSVLNLKFDNLINVSNDVQQLLYQKSEELN